MAARRVRMRHDVPPHGASEPRHPFGIAGGLVLSAGDKSVARRPRMPLEDQYRDFGLVCRRPTMRASLLLF